MQTMNYQVVFETTKETIHLSCDRDYTHINGRNLFTENELNHFHSDAGSSLHIHHAIKKKTLLGLIECLKSSLTACR